MHLSIIWAVIGFGSLFAAGFFVSQVESAELGIWSSRFVALLLGILTYYGCTSLFDTFIPLPLHPVKYEFMKYAMPVVAIIGLGFLGWKVRKNWNEETTKVMKSGRRLTIIVVLALLGRFFLSL